ncbi:MAG: DEAD/DEAH box helicase family protein, partial [Candidatus Omnitrophica bacterium]|nr:DEAD/DEAH box helicase family protein [Candidatus Omnitrophota bacterium]
MRLYLKDIVDSVNFNTLPKEWTDFDFVSFSSKKKLFDFQQDALKNAVKGLYKFYKDCKADKQEFLKLYTDNGLIQDEFGIEMDRDKMKIFQDFINYYSIEDNKIRFEKFINRMSFWMATGSGKTLVIVKLIEILAKLIKDGQIPKNDILFLTYREDLIEQFKRHIDEFNSSSRGIRINLKDLKDYESVKRENRIKFSDEIDVFYYRSDLISDEQKEKFVNFKNYDNDGKWFIFLDEAHKGDKQESKRQLYYIILSRNGFLFNFSATFVDEIDFVTCVFNFNLEKFIQAGYGKHIYISQSDIEGLGMDQEFDKDTKKIIILKLFILYTLIKKSKPDNYYHKPLILTLVNSVNTEDSDLELFF